MTIQECYVDDVYGWNFLGVAMEEAWSRIPYEAARFYHK